MVAWTWSFKNPTYLNLKKALVSKSQKPWFSLTTSLNRLKIKYFYFCVSFSKTLKIRLLIKYYSNRLTQSQISNFDSLKQSHAFLSIARTGSQSHKTGRTPLWFRNFDFLVTSLNIIATEHLILTLSPIKINHSPTPFYSLYHTL